MNGHLRPLTEIIVKKKLGLSFILKEKGDTFIVRQIDESEK